MNDQSDNRVKTAVRTFRMLQAIQELDGGTLSELVDYLEMPKTTVYEYVSTLEDIGYVRRDDGEYRLGLRFLDHGIFARNQHAIAHVGRSVIRHLADEMEKLAAWLVVEEGGQGIFIDGVLGSQAVKTYARVGTHSHLHYLASGKSMLANMPRARVEEIVDEHGLPARTSNTISDREVLFEELDRIRERGYAVNKDEVTHGTRAIGDAVIVDGQVRGAITLVGPANRLAGGNLEERAVQQLLGATNEVELKLSTVPEE